MKQQNFVAPTEQNGLPEWNKRDPQIPKSKWWLTDAPLCRLQVSKAFKTTICRRDRKILYLISFKLKKIYIMNTDNKNSRREFVKNSALITGGVMTMPLLSKANFFSGAEDTIKVALIGCGGRGTGAAMQACLTKQNVKLVAMADAFRDRIDKSYKLLTGDDITEGSGTPKNIKNRIDVPEERKYTGFDGYKKAMAHADVVILTTPPGFRPIHFEEAVNQGKQIFMEKPVATDPAGIQKVLAAALIAKQKKLNVVVGLQRHYQILTGHCMQKKI
jgi:hypothetical protein